mgnify:CR=1 FL=1
MQVEGLAKMDNRIKRLREAKDITLRDLGEKLSINYGTLSRMENGLQPMLDEYAVKLARFFGVSVDYLLCVVNENGTVEPAIVYRDRPLTYDAVSKALNTFSNLELARLAGTIEGITNERLRMQAPTNGNGNMPKAPEAPQSFKKVN